MDKFIKKLIFPFILFVLFGVLPFFLAGQGKAHAQDSAFDSSCSAAKDLEISVDWHTPDKFFAGETVTYEIRQPDDTEYKTGAVLGTKPDGSAAAPLTSDQVIYNYRIYLAKADALNNFKQQDTGIIRPEEDRVRQFNLPVPTGEGTFGSPGEYVLRFVIDDMVRYKPDRETHCLLYQVHDDQLIIANTLGIRVKSSSDIIKKGDTATITVKFYGLKGQTYKIFIDNDSNKKAEGIIGDDNIPINISWDTSETNIDSYKIIAKAYPGTPGTDNNKTEYSVTVNETGTDGSGAGSGGGSGRTATISLSTLDRINVKNLLTQCKSKADLEQLVCSVETVTTWLLDIGAVIAFIMILYASIIYLTSYGEESKAELAKKTLTWSVIGVIVIGAAMAIMKIIENVLNNPSSLK